MNSIESNDGEKISKVRRTYLEWNDAIASSIFRPEMAGKEVFLFVNDELIEELGGAESVKDFVEAVEQGPPWVNPELSLCQKAIHTLEDWRDRGLRFPPYIGFLALFVLAVGIEGQFAAHAYYSRLRTLLGWPDVDAGAPPSFYRMLLLWEDLEVWSNHDMDGEIGVFSIRIAGEWIHVGLPKAQAVLTENERRALPVIFAAADFDPTALPSDDELALELGRHGKQVLRARTLELLTQPSSESDLSAFLLDAVRGELEEWDGETQADEESIYTIAALARVCIKLDQIAGRATTTIRVVAKADFPDDGLMLESLDGSIHLACKESRLPGWSSPLRDFVTQQIIDADVFNWSEPLLLTDRAAGWRVRLPGKIVRIFIDGLSLELPGLVEVRGLQRNQAFFLAASDEAIHALDIWAESGEVELNRMNIIEGLPSGWTLYKSPGAKADDSIRHALPELALPSLVRVRLDGGIRSGQGNTYFRFAPPAVVVDGATGDEEVFCDEIMLQPVIDGLPTYTLPARLSIGSRITIEVHRKGEVLRRQSLFLSEQFDWRLANPIFAADPFGTIHEWRESFTNEIAGALGGPEIVEGFPIRPDICSSRRIFAIGRHPGEIRTFPSHDSSQKWHPIWLINLSRRGHAEYCGLDFASSHPGKETVGTSDDLALWKEVIWRKRKRIKPPEHIKLQALWREYVEVAAHV